MKLSSPSPTTAVYRISLLPSYHSPPEHAFDSLNVTFSSPLTQQEQQVSVTFLESDQSCPTTPTLDPSDTPTQATQVIVYPSPYLYYIIIIVVAMILVTIVICLALNKTSSVSKQGFSSHLPTPGGVHGSPQNTLSPMMGTPSTHPRHPPPSQPQTLYSSSGYQGSSASFNVSQHGRTPVGHGSGVTSPTSQGGFNRTGLSSSPGQHGLFSQ